MIKEYQCFFPFTDPPVPNGPVSIDLRHVISAQPDCYRRCDMTYIRMSVPGADFAIGESYDRFMRDWLSVKR